MREACEEMVSLSIGEMLWQELRSRGFDANGEAPHGSMGLEGVSEICSTSVRLAELLDTMVSRREKLTRSFGTVPVEDGRRRYEDVVLVIEALKVVIGKLSLVRAVGPEGQET